MTLPLDPVQDIEVSLFSCIACIIDCVCIGRECCDGTVSVHRLSKPADVSALLV